MTLARFVPATMAAATDVFTGILVSQNQRNYPVRFVIYQIAMVGLCLLLASPYRRWWVALWITAFLLLILGVWLAGFSVGLFYIPTVVAAGWVMVRRVESASSVGDAG